MSQRDEAIELAERRYEQDGDHRIVYKEPESETVLNDEGDRVKEDTYYVCTVRMRRMYNGWPGFLNEDAEEIYRTTDDG